MNVSDSVGDEGSDGVHIFVCFHVNRGIGLPVRSQLPANLGHRSQQLSDLSQLPVKWRWRACDRALDE